MSHPIVKVPEETRPQSYVIYGFSERSGADIHKVTDATQEELRDLVVYYHIQLEETKRLLERSLNAVNSVLGYDDL